MYILYSNHSIVGDEDDAKWSEVKCDYDYIALLLFEYRFKN